MLVGVMLLPAQGSVAEPQGGDVVYGAAGIVTAGNVTTIDQHSASAIVNWQRFSIAPSETVIFNQPTSESIMLNRVIGNETSVIAGALNANGRIFLINSAGVLFTKDAQVNVGGLVASTLNISNKDFIAGNYVFAGNSKASVINSGEIRAERGGYVALLGNHVANEGTIEATLGTVALASGDRVTLNFGGNSLLDVTVNKGALKALVENRGVIKADGGRVVMTARAADALLSAQVNNTGVIQARTMAGLTGGGSRAGLVRISAIRGAVHVAGRIDASAPNGGRGGVIATRGARVMVARDAALTTRALSGKHGGWTIGSRGIVIGKGGNIGAAQLAKLLQSNDVAIHSTGGGKNGDITIKGAVNWTEDTKLALDARRNINIGANLSATGREAGLSLAFGGDYAFGRISNGIALPGARARLTINGESYALINTLAELAALSTDPDAIASGFYALGGDIDASGTVFSGPVIYALDGTLAGLGHAVRNLTIYDAFGANEDALIAHAGPTAVIRDIGLINANVYADPFSALNTAGLVSVNDGLIQNAYTDRTAVSGYLTVGGLVAANSGPIINSYVTNGFVTGQSDVGGLAGVSGLFGSISGSHATGLIVARTLVWTDTGLVNSARIGGLVGLNGGSISDSYANVGIAAYNSQKIGGLVGENTAFFVGFGGSITNARASGWINETWDSRVGLDNTAIGGLVGHNSGGMLVDTRSDLIISLTNRSGQLVPITSVGGLVGVNDLDFFATDGGNIDRGVSNTSIFADGWVNKVGGLIGNVIAGTVTDSFARGLVTTGVDVYPGGTGGLFGNIFNKSLVTSEGNGWDVNRTGQVAGAGFGGATLGGMRAVGDTSRGSLYNLAPTVDQASLTPRALRVSASQLGTTVSTANTQSASSAPPRKRLASAGTAATNAASDAAFDEYATMQAPPSQPPSGVAPARTTKELKPSKTASLGGAARGTAPRAADESDDRRPHIRAAPQPHKVVVQKPKEPDYGAAIRSIEIDGKKFDLQEKPATPGKPNPPQ